MRKALGRGLDALIPPAPNPIAPELKDHRAPMLLPLSKIRPNHLQPRRHFDPEKLAELSASIREHGLAQPIVVSYDPGSDTYELIAGERRLRASELAGVTEIEAVLKNPENDQKRLALALIENLQREDLNPIEEALGYLRLIKEFNVSQTDLGRLIGKSKSAISNTLRLLELPQDIQKAMQFGQLSEAHGRALLMVHNAFERKKLFDLAVEHKLSVREVENFARQIEAGMTIDGKDAPPPSPASRVAKAADIILIESDLQQKLGTKVEIKTKKDQTKGCITIHFFSLDDFDKVIKTLKK